MQYFDGEIERLIRSGEIDFDVGMSYSTNPNNLRIELADLVEDRRVAEREALKAAEAAGLPEAIDESEILR
jgi:hypothetical protein